MRIHWQKIKDGTRLFEEGGSAVYFVPTVGRIYVTAKQEKSASNFGPNPVCHLEIASVARGEAEPLFLIVSMENAPLKTLEPALPG